MDVKFKPGSGGMQQQEKKIKSGVKGLVLSPTHKYSDGAEWKMGESKGQGLLSDGI